jgi:hypothetical protein
MSNLMLGSSSYLIGTNDTADVLLNNISPMDANQPNGLAAGIIQVQTALGSGVDLVGTRSSLSERLAVQMPADGRVIPPGTIVMTGRNTAPVGWLICDGAAVDRTLFAALYAAIGNTFGPGNGTTTFNLPDMRSTRSSSFPITITRVPYRTSIRKGSRRCLRNSNSSSGSTE